MPNLANIDVPPIKPQYKNSKFEKVNKSSLQLYHHVRASKNRHTFAPGTKKLQRHAVNVLRMTFDEGGLELADGTAFDFRPSSLIFNDRTREAFDLAFIHLMSTFPAVTVRSIWRNFNGWLTDHNFETLHEQSVFVNFWADLRKTTSAMKDKNGYIIYRDRPVRPKEQFTGYDLAIVFGAGGFDFTTLVGLTLALLMTIMVGTGCRISNLVHCVQTAGTGARYKDIRPMSINGNDRLAYKWNFDKCKNKPKKWSAILAPPGESMITHVTNPIYLYCLYAYLQGAFVETDLKKILFEKKWTIKRSYRKKLIFTTMKNNKFTSQALSDSAVRLLFRTFAFRMGIRALAMLPHALRRGFINWMIRRQFAFTGFYDVQPATDAVDHMSKSCTSKHYDVGDNRMATASLDETYGKSATESAQTRDYDTVTMTSILINEEDRISTFNDAILHAGFGAFVMKNERIVALKDKEIDRAIVRREITGSTLPAFLIAMNEMTHSEIRQSGNMCFTKSYPSMPTAIPIDKLDKFVKRISREKLTGPKIGSTANTRLNAIIDIILKGNQFSASTTETEFTKTTTQHVSSYTTLPVKWFECKKCGIRLSKCADWYPALHAAECTVELKKSEEEEAIVVPKESTRQKLARVEQERDALKEKCDYLMLRLRTHENENV